MVPVFVRVGVDVSVPVFVLVAVRVKVGVAPPAKGISVV